MSNTVDWEIFVSLFFRVRNVRTSNFRHARARTLKMFRAFNFRCLSNRRKIFNSENFLIYGIALLLISDVLISNKVAIGPAGIHVSCDFTRVF